MTTTGSSMYGCSVSHHNFSFRKVHSCVLSVPVAFFRSQGQVYGKPVNQGITQLKPNRNHRAMAEERVGRKIGGLRVLNSYWVNQVSCMLQALKLGHHLLAAQQLHAAGCPANCLHLGFYRQHVWQQNSLQSGLTVWSSADTHTAMLLWFSC